MTSKGDFIGFTLGGVHSVDLGVMRVSDGSRYTENLLPTMQDKTVQVPGGDGAYLFGSYYTQKSFSIQIAYDEMSEENIRQLRALMARKEPQELIFDELPYKKYLVKANGTPNLKYVCFEKENEFDSRVGDVDEDIHEKDSLYGVGTRIMKGRVYKGEGTLQFITYVPYARSRYKYLDDYNINNVPEWGSMDSALASDVFFNYYEWRESSRMKLSTATLTMPNRMNYALDRPVTTGCAVYNAGDIETPFWLQIFGSGTISIGLNFRDHHFALTGARLYTGDAGLQINTKLNLVEGIDADGELTGTVYNRFITAGDFFKIPPTDFLELISFINVQGATSMKIKYDYLYY